MTERHVEGMNSLKGLISVFTSIRIDEDSGIILQNLDADPGYVRKIRLWNFLEPCAVYGLILAVIWLSMLDMRLWWVRPSFGALVAWVLVISPLVHYRFERDLFLKEEQKRHGLSFFFFECRGLGSPLRYYLPLDGERPHLFKYFKTILCVAAFIDLLFICAFITFNQDIAPRVAAHVGNGFWAGILLRAGALFALDAGLIFIAFPFMLRLDNFRQSLRFIVGFMILLAVLTLIGNLLFQANETSLRRIFEHNPYMSLRGDPAAQRLKSLGVFAVGGQWSGYVFWGFLQQLLFSSIFAVQFCRAFDVGRSRLHFFAACLCTAAFFGIIHIPNFWLSIVTWIGGFFGAMFFMQCRNLFAFGLVHGFGGTITNKLLPINFSVGPSQVPH